MRRLPEASMRLPEADTLRLPSRNSSTAASTILPTPPPSAALIASAPLTRLCAVCARQLSRYSCPQCNVQSCSLPCYRQHSQRCTDRFHEQETRAAMTRTKADDDTQKAMRAIIARAQTQQHEDDMTTFADGESETAVDEAEEEELQQLADAPLESLSLSSLSAEQQQRFLRAVKDGRLSHLLPIATPWWVPSGARHLQRRPTTSVDDSIVDKTDDEGQQLEDTEVLEVEVEWKPCVDRTRGVQEMREEGDDGDDGLHSFMQSLPPLSSLSPVAPSPLLRYHVLDLLSSFCHTYRVYNCDPHSDTPAFLADLLALTSVLSPSSASTALPHLTSTSTTLLHFISHTRSLPSLHQSNAFTLIAILDALHLSMNPLLALRAMKEMWDIMGEVRAKERLKRKLWYLLLWMHDQGTGPMLTVAEEGLRVLKEQQRALSSTHSV